MPVEPVAIAVEVDEEVELLQSLARLAGFEEFHAPEVPESPWLADLDAALAPHADHPAVEATRRLRRSGIGYHALASLGMDLDADLRLLVPLDPRPEGMDPRWDAALAEAYLAEVRAFREVSGWRAFWEAHADARHRVEAAYTEWLTEAQVYPWFEDTFPTSSDAEVVVTPSFTSGHNNYGTFLRRADGTWLRRPVVGVALDGAGLPEFGVWELPVLVHEIAHGFAGPWVARAPEEAAAVGRAARKRVGPALAREAYPTDALVANETVTRGITQLFLRDRDPAAAEGFAILGEDGQSFFWVREVADALERHRAGPRGALDLDAAGPDVVAAVTAWSRGWPHEPRGTADLCDFRKRWSWAATDGIRPYAESIATWLVDDRGYRATEHGPSVDPASLRTPAFYGRPDHPWAAPALASVDVEVRADGVRIGDRFWPGEHLAFLACLPVGETAMYVYTAADDADLDRINTLSHGAADWQIGVRGDGGWRTVAYGAFPRVGDVRRGVWLDGEPGEPAGGPAPASEAPAP